MQRERERERHHHKSLSNLIDPYFKTQNENTMENTVLIFSSAGTVSQTWCRDWNTWKKQFWRRWKHGWRTRITTTPFHYRTCTRTNTLTVTYNYFTYFTIHLHTHIHTCMHEYVQVQAYWFWFPCCSVKEGR